MIENLFLDRDGVINEVVMRGDVVSSPRSIQEFRLKSDFLEFCEKIKSYKLNVFVVSNQPDIARGLMTLEALSLMDEEIRQHINVTKISYCIHDNSDNCHCRKPKPGLISDILTMYGLNRKTSLIVGDSFKDIIAGKSAGVATAYLRADYNLDVVADADCEINNLSEIFQQKGIFEFDYKSVN